jgi:hypothetical protein
MTQLASHALATCKSPGFTCPIQPAARPHEFLGGILTRFYTEMAQLRALLAPAIVGAQDAEPTSTELAQHELLKDSTAEAQKRKMEGG